MTAEAPSTLTLDLACISCGYNLRGLRRSGVCPECATTIALSIQGTRLECADPDWVWNVATGLRQVLWGYVLIWPPCIFIGVVLGVILNEAWPLCMLCCIAGLFTLLGYLSFTACEPTLFDSREPTFSLRRCARSLAVAAFLFVSLLGILILLEYGGSIYRTPWIALIALLNLARTCAMLGYGRQIALRIPDRSIAGQCRTAQRGLAVTGVIALPAIDPVCTPLLARLFGSAGFAFGLSAYVCAVFVLFALLIARELAGLLRRIAAMERPPSPP